MKRCRERELLVLAAIRAGHTLTGAAHLAGISYLTLIRWKQRGKADDAKMEHRRFTEEIENLLTA